MVDTLCLDKTGTITQGKMTVEALHSLSDKFSDETVGQILAAYIQTSEDNNPTAQAIRKGYATWSTPILATMSSHFLVTENGALCIYPVSELSFWGHQKCCWTAILQRLERLKNADRRVLVLAHSDQVLDKHSIQLPEDMTALAVLEITDPIREGAAETLDYLRSQDVDLKIISGDNPVTVSHIASQAGFANYDSYIDCSKISDQELVEQAEETAIFGRVSPHQKKLLIQTLKAAGRTTAMTGDGVNDILALREADCSIVMAEGDPATRQIANLVLLNSDFNDVPEILFEGRRVVNNIGRIAPIFFIKTIYSFILLSSVSPVSC